MTENEKQSVQAGIEMLEALRADVKSASRISRDALILKLWAVEDMLRSAEEPKAP